MDFGRSSSLVCDAGRSESESESELLVSLLFSSRSRSRSRSLSFCLADKVLILFYYGAMVGRGRLKGQGTGNQASRSQGWFLISGDAVAMLYCNENWTPK